MHPETQKIVDEVLPNLNPVWLGSIEHIQRDGKAIYIKFSENIVGTMAIISYLGKNHKLSDRFRFDFEKLSTKTNLIIYNLSLISLPDPSAQGLKDYVEKTVKFDSEKRKPTSDLIKLMEDQTAEIKAEIEKVNARSESKIPESPIVEKILAILDSSLKKFIKQIDEKSNIIMISFANPFPDQGLRAILTQINSVAQGYRFSLEFIKISPEENLRKIIIELINSDINLYKLDLRESCFLTKETGQKLLELANKGELEVLGYSPPFNMNSPGSNNNSDLSLDKVKTILANNKSKNEFEARSALNLKKEFECLKQELKFFKDKNEKLMDQNESLAMVIEALNTQVENTSQKITKSDENNEEVFKENLGLREQITTLTERLAGTETLENENATLRSLAADRISGAAQLQSAIRGFFAKKDFSKLVKEDKNKKEMTDKIQKRIVTAMSNNDYDTVRTLVDCLQKGNLQEAVSLIDNNSVTVAASSNNKN